ncbi:hypothetical protein DL93DRAFT_1148595 [Clavulina sp. PMI_390]|nr:hypothetical protein DL93DRAFT_1148595 [Clavulina sp. PMI_390]
MDVILHVADYYVLDNLWAKLLPLEPAHTVSVNASRPVWLDGFIESLPQFLQPPSLDPLTAVASSSPFFAPSVSAWPREYFVRQILSVATLTMIGIVALYMIFAGLSYYFIFDHRMMRHPRFLKNQVKLEIETSMQSFPGMMVLTLPWFMGEVRGYSRLYSNVEDYGLAYLILSVPFFLLFTDYCIYWIHRWLHLPWFYKNIHKPHHKWLIPTPFASHAFHPVDGYSQSVPYHLFVFLFPMHQHLYLALFVAINFWSIFIHDSDMLVSAGSKVERFINTPAHHTLHHLYFTCNYGQYFTWADRYGGSYRAPQADLDPILEILALDKAGVAKAAEEKEAIIESKKDQ